MEILRAFLFKIILPMVWLALFAYVFAASSLKLVKAWKAKNFQQIWLYLWIILVGLYFLVCGGKP